MSPSNAVECYPCREVSMDYIDLLLFHGGDTGSTPVWDATISNLIKAHPVEAALKNDRRKRGVHATEALSGIQWIVGIKKQRSNRGLKLRLGSGHSRNKLNREISEFTHAARAKFLAYRVGNVILA